MADETSYHLYFQKDSPHQNVFKLTLSQKSFYVFRKDRQCKFIFLLSPSLDLINIISVLEAMRVASETLQRSRRTLPAAGSYLQPCLLNIVKPHIILTSNHWKTQHPNCLFSFTLILTLYNLTSVGKFSTLFSIYF